VRRLSGADLLLSALTAGQLSVLIPVCIFIANLGENFVGTNEAHSALGLAPHSVGGWLIAVAALLLVAWLALVAATIVALGGFTVSRDGDRLRIKRGFIVHRETTIPIGRIRAVEIVEGLLRRPFGLVSIRIEVIGHAKEHATARVFFPLLRRAEVAPFFEVLLPELADDPNGLEPPPERALRRYVLPPALAALVAGVAAWQLVDTGAWILLAAIPAAFYGAARYRVAGWRLANGRLAIRSLRLARTTVLAPVANNEGYGLAQTPFQRRAGLASLKVRFGKKTTARIQHLDAGAAAEAFAAIGAPALPSRD
jgi:putative membrane protein